jgi:hypothetical protein
MKLLQTERTQIDIYWTLHDNGGFALPLDVEWMSDDWGSRLRWFQVNIYFLCFQLAIYREFI